MPPRGTEPSGAVSETGIDPAECLALLGASGIGRVVVSVGAVPALYPVSYAVLDGEVVFRTARGTDLHAAMRNTVVAFEVDDTDPVDHEGWVVQVVGTADEVTDQARRARLEKLAWPTPATGPPQHMVTIRSELVSGRRIVLTP
jgi:nitroimidazol reductase NimA-like FMN-containing flavoprotein (pyridoxamine 5'-phosphate oxidase superfamily)